MDGYKPMPASSPLEDVGRADRVYQLEKL